MQKLIVKNSQWSDPLLCSPREKGHVMRPLKLCRIPITETLNHSVATYSEQAGMSIHEIYSQFNKYLAEMSSLSAKSQLAPSYTDPSSRYAYAFLYSGYHATLLEEVAYDVVANLSYAQNEIVVYSIEGRSGSDLLAIAEICIDAGIAPVHINYIAIDSEEGWHEWLSHIAKSTEALLLKHLNVNVTINVQSHTMAWFNSARFGDLAEGFKNVDLVIYNHFPSLIQSQIQDFQSMLYGITRVTPDHCHFFFIDRNEYGHTARFGEEQLRAMLQPFAFREIHYLEISFGRRADNDILGGYIKKTVSKKRQRNPTKHWKPDAFALVARK